MRVLRHAGLRFMVPVGPHILLVAERLCYPRIAQRMRAGSNGKGRTGKIQEQQKAPWEGTIRQRMRSQK